jgi:3' terminal RNA ribose 2'-O-methyltransferase Hen1
VLLTVTLTATGNPANQNTANQNTANQDPAGPNTAGRPATDLGYLLYKHPDRVQAFAVAAGTAHVFYPRADPQQCTAALLLDVDPIALVRGRPGSTAGGSGHYVDDRPYAAGSLLAVALRTVFGSAMNGRCDLRPELAATALPLIIRIPTLRCRGGAALVERLFAPLGWQVRTTVVPLDPEIPEWGDSTYLDTTLTGELRVADALTQLYVLLPVLDDAKHYWVGEDEVAKLLRVGESWLPGHPERVLITDRYLAHQRAHVRSALDRLAESDETAIETIDNALAEPLVTAPAGAVGASAEAGGRPAPLAARRRACVLTELRAVGARRILDLGCGGGALLRDLIADRSFVEIVGVDVSARALQVAARRLHLDRPPARGRVTLRQSALTYTDASLTGFDAAVLMEVIEHVDLTRLPALEHAVFATARPDTVVVTTPNAEYNVRFEALGPGRFRHADHRFEWTRAQFGNWARRVAGAHGYAVALSPVGPVDREVGPPTQLAVFTTPAVDHAGSPARAARDRASA